MGLSWHLDAMIAIHHRIKRVDRLLGNDKLLAVSPILIIQAFHSRLQKARNMKNRSKTVTEMHLLRQVLDRVNPPTDDAWAEADALVSSRAVVLGEHLLRAGERATRVFFVRHGLLREYYLDHAGHESTRRFCDEGEFSGSLADLLSGAAAAHIEREWITEDLIGLPAGMPVLAAA